MISVMSAAVLVCLLGGCAGQSARTTTSSRQATPTPHSTVTPTAATYAGTSYTDAKLGFQIRMPDGWQAAPQPGLRAPADQASLLFENGRNATIQIGVLRGAGMAAAFGQRGTPTAQVGSYPAFRADTSLAQGKVPCLARIFLAGQDYVLATWCAMDASSHAAEFDTLLATYEPAQASFQPNTAAIPTPAPQSCAAAQTAHGYEAGGLSWGRMLAAPNASAAPYQLDASVCSNTSSPDQYLFECTELVNRVIREQWGLPHIPGSAARYLDYFQDGTLHPGMIRDFPVGSYQVSDDASQGTSAFAPRPGDLLVFQDVVDPGAGWRSGLAASPGHVAIITGVDASHVYVAQENYSDSQYFLALPMTRTARGWAITDHSGLPSRIVRGWIYLAANGESS
jgi:hypothetical protein